MRLLGNYIREILRLSFATWGTGQRGASLLGVLIAVALAGLAALGIQVTFTPSAIASVAIGLGLWFLFVVFFYSPYRAWRAQRQQLAGLRQAAELPAYVRENIERLREAVIQVRQEWTKFSAGISEDERWRLLRELLVTSDPYRADPRLGSMVSQIQSDAMRMAVIASGRGAGEAVRAEALALLDRSLQQIILDLLEATNRYVIYQQR
jgi:hypothetical protein